MTDVAAQKVPLTPYQRRLFFFLAVASFFEGYDFFALAQLLPEIRESFDLNEAQGGWLVGLINSGTIIAFFLIRKADSWGRRKLLVLTILGYTICTGLTALAWDAYSFGMFQLLGRIFLIAEWATCMVYAAEEYPADRRGFIIGALQAMTSFGGIACAGLVPILATVPVLGWRTVYLSGIAPLIIIAIWRRGLKESSRFEPGEKTETKSPLFKIWSTAYRRRVIQLGVIWGLCYTCTTVAVTFWKEFAIAERGFTQGDVGSSITVAALVSMPMVFYCGKLLDKLGRRPASAIIFSLLALSTITSYTFEGWWLLTLSLIFSIFASTAVAPVLNAFTTELFPTSLRADGFGWVNNILGRLSYVVAPIVVGAGAHSMGWSMAVSLTAIGPIIAIGAVYLWLPETQNMELEETSVMT